MKLKYKNSKIICLVFFIFLVFILGLLFVQSEQKGIVIKENQDISGYLGEDVKSGSVRVSNVNFDYKTSSVEFVSKDSLLVLKDSNGKEIIFGNVKPADKSTSAYFTFENGQIREADFTTNEKGGVYQFGRDIIPAPPNTRVRFVDGKLSLDIPSGTKISQLPSVNKKSTLSSNQITLNGKGIIFPSKDSLSGEISCSNGNCFVKKGTSISINGYSVNAKNTDVFLKLNPNDLFNSASLNENFVKSYGGKIYAQGNGFTVSYKSDNSLIFQDGQLPVDLKSSRNHKYFQLGDSGEDIKQIQRIIGMREENIDGNYDAVTVEAVKKWQKENKLSADGLFGKKSLLAANGLSSDSESSSIMFELKKGSVMIDNNKKGIFSDLRGNVNAYIGNKKYTYNGVDLFESLVSSKSNSPVQIPVTLNLLDQNSKLKKSIPLYKDFLKSNAQLVSRFDNSDREKINSGFNLPEDVTNCAALVTLATDTTSSGKFVPGKISKDLGVYGDAWQMQQNILAMGGENIYNKYNDLTFEQKQEIEKLRQKTLQDAQTLRNSGLSDEAIDLALSVKLIPQMRAILGKNSVSSQLNLQEGDVVSLFNSFSNHMSQPLLYGKGNQYNTHVGIVTGFSDRSFTLNSEENQIIQVKKNLGLTGDSSLFLNRYYYRDSISGSEIQVFFNGKNFVSSSGENVDLSGGTFLVKVPQVSHHAGGFNTEDLPKLTESFRFSIYGITRPAYVDAVKSRSNLDTIKLSDINLDCTNPDIDCAGFDLGEKLDLNNIPSAKKWASLITKSTVERQKELNLPESQIKDFQTMTAAIISQESQFGDSRWFKVKNTANLVGAGNRFSSKGYMQISELLLKDIADKYHERAERVDLSNPDSSLKYGQRYLGELFKIYTTPGEKPSEEELSFVAAAYNSGRYSPWNAGVQYTLQELGYMGENDKLDGILGDKSKTAIFNFAFTNGLDYTPEQIDELAKNPDLFVKSDIYALMKDTYKETFGVFPPKAQIPDRTTKGDLRNLWKDRTVSGYQKQVINNYKKYG